MNQKRYEPFKESARSICRQCFNLESDCFNASKTCGTDSKAGKSFVERCGSFNKDLAEIRKSKANTIAVDNAADSRIEMMGGGFKELE